MPNETTKLNAQEQIRKAIDELDARLEKEEQPTGARILYLANMYVTADRAVAGAVMAHANALVLAWEVRQQRA